MVPHHLPTHLPPAKHVLAASPRRFRRRNSSTLSCRQLIASVACPTDDSSSRRELRKVTCGAHPGSSPARTAHLFCPAEHSVLSHSRHKLTYHSDLATPSRRKSEIFFLRRVSSPIVDNGQPGWCPGGVDQRPAIVDAALALFHLLRSRVAIPRTQERANCGGRPRREAFSRRAAIPQLPPCCRRVHFLSRCWLMLRLLRPAPLRPVLSLRRADILATPARHA